MSNITYGKIARQIGESRKILSDLHFFKVEIGSRTDYSRERIKELIQILESSDISTWSWRIIPKYDELVRLTNYIGTVMWNQDHGTGNGDIHREKIYGHCV